MAAARTLLLRLADEDESGAIVRRRIELAELEAEGSSGLLEVVARLTDRRLLTVSDGAVEVAHEALLREWPRLRAWLDAHGKAAVLVADRPGRALGRVLLPYLHEAILLAEEGFAVPAVDADAVTVACTVVPFRFEERGTGLRCDALPALA